MDWILCLMKGGKKENKKKGKHEGSHFVEKSDDGESNGHRHKLEFLKRRLKDLNVDFTEWGTSDWARANYSEATGVCVVRVALAR